MILRPVLFTIHFLSFLGYYRQHIGTLTDYSSLSRVLVGASSDSSINVDDPISDEFFFLTWNEPAKLNASIYDKV